MTIETKLTPGVRHDLFAAIQYEQRQGRKRSVTGKQLGAHFVFSWIVEDAWKHFSASIATASRFRLHTAEDLFADPQTWAGYETAIRIAIGRCLMYFVDNKMLPLTCSNPGSSGTKLYARTDP